MTKLNTWPCIRRISVKHIPDFSEYVLPLLKKKIIKFLSIVPIQATYPQAESEAPSKRNQALTHQHQPAGHLFQPCYSLWLSQGRSGPASLPDPSKGGPLHTVALGLGLRSCPGSTLWISPSSLHIWGQSRTARTWHQAQFPGNTCLGGECG